MNGRPVDKTKKSNIKCAHCKYSCKDNVVGYYCLIHDRKKKYWNRCKDFDWK